MKLMKEYMNKKFLRTLFNLRKYYENQGYVGYINKNYEKIKEK